MGDEEGSFYEERLTEKLGRGFRAQFGFIITSDNIMEVLIINYVLRALLIGSSDDLSTLGFDNPRYSCQDLNVRPEILPANVYCKGILLNSIYNDTFPSVGKYEGFKEIVFILDKVLY